MQLIITMKYMPTDRKKHGGPDHQDDGNDAMYYFFPFDFVLSLLVL